ncbi:hypothetical protein [Nitrobacter sp. JJSN]|uniref:hypothetical protein n=1 Tax=Nitrobacter sp. JJSN TaxID=3453033 RepID=UPI003F76A3D0
MTSAISLLGVLIVRHANVAFLIAMFFVYQAAAQTTSVDNKSSESKHTSAEVPAPSSTDMSPVAVGDHWTYEIRDNVTGNLKGQYTQTVTDTSSTDVSVSVLALGASLPSYIVFDHLWNLKTTPLVKFVPNDGTGVKEAMKVGDTWSVRTSDIRASRTAWKRTEKSKVIGEEPVSTQAGTFNAIKYETTIDIRGAIDPTKKGSTVLTTWFSPSVNHWVKRAEKTVTDKHVVNNTTIELVDYGRQ